MHLHGGEWFLRRSDPCSDAEKDKDVLRFHTATLLNQEGPRFKHDHTYWELNAPYAVVQWKSNAAYAVLQWLKDKGILLSFQMQIFIFILFFKPGHGALTQW